MGKKMKFPFLSNPGAIAAAAAGGAWTWPACADLPKTPSFRAYNIHRAMNPSFIDDKITTESSETEQICDSIHQNDNVDLAVAEGLRSNRLFFDPGGKNSILEGAELPYEEDSCGVSLMAMDSMDPFHDFRASMEEMVAAHGLNDWECLEELVRWYLRVNAKSNHGYIVGAFVDLLIHLSLADSVDSVSTSAIDENCSCSSSTATPTQGSFTSPLSFDSSTCCSTSPCLSALEHEEEIVVEKNECFSSSSSSRV